MNGDFAKYLWAFILLTLPMAACAQEETISTPELTWQQMNTALGVPLFSDKDFWQEDVTAVGKRLQWPQESLTKTLCSYRLYAEGEQKFLGVKAYSMALYGKDGKVEDVSIALCNMGDFSNWALSTIDDAKERKKALSLDTKEEMMNQFRKSYRMNLEAIVKNLTNALGKKRRTRFSTGPERVTADRWDWKDLSFMLIAQEDEYIHLLIIPKSFADSEGKLKSISEDDLKKLLLPNVEKRPNGDVVITQIPMINQGEKGFCVPATFERLLRYMGIPADMYMIAMAAETGVGGGTRMDILDDKLYQIVIKAGRRLISTGDGLNIYTISDYVNKGIPLVWTLEVDPEFYQGKDSAMAKRMADRKGMTDPKVWKEILKRDIKLFPKPEPNYLEGHACLIIGYNKETGEMAFSDSWGPSFQERWMTIDEAKALTNGNLKVITW